MAIVYSIRYEVDIAPENQIGNFICNQYGFRREYYKEHDEARTVLLAMKEAEEWSTKYMGDVEFTVKYEDEQIEGYSYTVKRDQGSAIKITRMIEESIWN